MYDDLNDDDVGIFDFNEFADLILDQGVQVSPSQLHGCLSGLLCAGAPTQPEYGLDALIQALDVEVHGELADRILQLYRVTGTALRDEEFSFNPLLPDDEEEITLRTNALANWCEGFLAGYAHQAAEVETGSAALPAQTEEVLSDIAAMAQAQAPDEESEEAEDSYMELVEYLRVAVLNVFAENPATSEDGDFSSGNGRPLH